MRVRPWSDDLDEIRAAGLLRRAATVERLGGGRLRVDGREYVDLASNDYLDLARDPRLAEAAARAARAHGAGAGAARAVVGRHPLLADLEDRLAAFKGTEAAIVLPSGYQAALAAVVALAGRGDTVLLERGAHASLVDGARLAAAAGATLRVWRRADLSTLERAIGRRATGRPVIVADSVHSMDGDVLDLPAVLEIARRHGAAVLLDDAHATGTLGATGRGILERFRLEAAGEIVVVGTLSKALGSQGGFVAGAREAVALVENRGRAGLFATALAPPAAGAALAALGIVEAEPDRLARLRENIAAFRDALGAPGESPVVPWVVGAPEAALAEAERLRAAGYWPAAIRPPTVPAGTARLRLSVVSAHSRPVLSNLAALLAQGGVATVR